MNNTDKQPIAYPEALALFGTLPINAQVEIMMARTKLGVVQAARKHVNTLAEATGIAKLVMADQPNA